jgi:hypothetical protein
MNVVGKDLEHFWMGHGDTEIGDRYSMLKRDVVYRQDVVARIGVGFDVPASLGSFEPNEPKTEPVVEAEIAVAA